MLLLFIRNRQGEKSPVWFRYAAKMVADQLTPAVFAEIILLTERFFCRFSLCLHFDIKAMKLYDYFHKTNITFFLSLSNFYISILFKTPPNFSHLIG